MALTKTLLIEDGAVTTTKIAGTVNLGGPKISNVSIANSSYAILDDTAVDTGGGYLVITGTGFDSGAQVIVNQTPALSTTYVNSTTLRAQVDSANAATYNIYVVNSDGGTATRINGLTYSGSPTWVTGSTLTNWNIDAAADVTFDATGATSYSNTTALPAGTTLLSNGYFYGTVTGIESETTYNFTVRATDDENQDSDRTFGLTVSPISLDPPTAVNYLVVAGGGGGGGGYYYGRPGAGGGAGGYRSGTLSISTSTQYNITVGTGGAGGSEAGGGFGGDGTSSTFYNISASGGGGGASGQSSTNHNGRAGGSGGGAQNADGVATGGAGNIGGYSPVEGYAGGGTGGAGYFGGGGAGGTTASGTGGPGRQWDDGNYYAGGGGSNNNPGGPGGGGYGISNNDSSAGTAGEVNTGGGGGGGSATSTTPSGGIGGSGGTGVVIIRYADTYADATATTGSPTYTNTGGYKTYKFTGSGSITW